MLRQIGLAIGVAILIAILGSPRTPHDVLHVYETSSWVIGAISFAGGAIGLALLSRRAQRSADPSSAGFAAVPAR
jgi:hypothetical protein